MRKSLTIVTYVQILCNTSILEALSPLISTKWKVQLDIGRQPGTWMPKRYPGWAESGARLGLDVSIEFTNNLLTSEPSEEFLGNANVKQLKVIQPETKFVNLQGTQRVSFESKGGWSIQYPQRAVRNASGGMIRPEGILRFWIDCSSGAKRQDVELFPNTRIFCTTGIWESSTSTSTSSSLSQLYNEYESIQNQLNQLVSDTRELKSAPTKNIWEEAINFRTMVSSSKKFDFLKARKEELEMIMPPLQAPTASNGVCLAPVGSLVQKGPKRNWWNLPEFLILGTFTPSPIDEEQLKE